MYKVYEIFPEYGCYSGIALVAAESVEEANEYIREFKSRDKDNKCDSWGYSYLSKDDDGHEHLFSDVKGIIDYGICYSG